MIFIWFLKNKRRTAKAEMQKQNKPNRNHFHFKKILQKWDSLTKAIQFAKPWPKQKPLRYQIFFLSFQLIVQTSSPNRKRTQEKI